MFLFTLFIPLVGLFFCISQATGVAIEHFCITQGCALTANISILGISLYWFGALAFAISFTLAMFQQKKLFFIFSIIFLALDIPLLTYLAFSLSCTSCMIIGFLFAIQSITGYLWHENRQVVKNWALAFTLPILCIWILIFTPNVVNAFKEVIFAPEKIYGKNNASIQIFFSPTCPSCKDMVLHIISEQPNDVSLYPVAKNNEDQERICALKCSLENNKDILESLKICFSKEFENQKKCNFQKHFTNAFMLHRNKQYLLSMGKTEVPIIITNTLIRTPLTHNKNQLNWTASPNSYFERQKDDHTICSFNENSNCEN